MFRRKYYSFYLLYCILFFATSCISSSNSFQLTNEDGKRISQRDYQNKILVMDFWATWCAPCIRAFPYLKLVQQKYALRSDVAFLMVTDEETEVATTFMKSRNYSFPLGFDTNKKVAYAFKVTGYPTTMVLDKKGQVRFVHRGFYLSDNIEEILSREIEALLVE